MPTDYFLVIDGIKGESKDSKHPDAIEISSFSWGNSNPGSSATGGGGGAGKATFQDLQFTSQASRAGPLLAQACASGLHIKKAQLFVRKQGDGQQDYYVISLEDLIVSSFHSGGSAGADAVPTDQFALNFATIQFEYKQQKDDGSLHPPVTAKYYLKENRASR
jgi:type VI secretion system secreted protein Hcp